ncbi:hypothetical protein WICMUC_003736 [Wickerhamomyces mucosus]|uniref:DH domain-containing protein n=1 Tax=Wickerhamomyces mucosus TaxID=1378264 RepID=A0A9P8PJL1_9ASCO|nr:hypothetical protein WICMUC_003736 [Wickerhamomyces mucosus]
MLRESPESSSPLSSLGSIQSSKPELLIFDNSFFNGKKSELDVINPQIIPDSIRNHQNEISFSNNINNDENYQLNDNIFIITEDTSPFLENYRLTLSSTDITSLAFQRGSSEIKDELIDEFPYTTISYIFNKISSGLSRISSQISEIQSSDFTTSSKLSENHLLKTNYQDLSPNSKNAFHRRKVIEEMIETEEGYISSLKMLSGIYLSPIIDKGNNGIPIRQLHHYVELLTALHESFVFDLTKLYYGSYTSNMKTSNIVYSFAQGKSNLTNTSPEMAALVAELVSGKTVNVNLYQEYSGIHDLVLKLIKSKQNDPEFGSILTKGVQNFLESTQLANERLDLSLNSLLQRPIARISKYKLFLQSLANLTPISEALECHEKIQSCLFQVDYSLKEINRYGSQEIIKSKVLFESLKFNCTKLNFPVEYLGLPLLLGSLYVSWVCNDQNQIMTELLGAFLFKTHMIFAKVNKQDNFDVRFLIPLSVSQLIDNNDINGGIFTLYKNCFKIRFETNYTIVELLLIQIDRNEYLVWRDKLDLVINHINGIYNLDYSSSKFNEEQGTNSSTIIPISEIQFYDVKVEKVKPTLSSFRDKSYSCYRGKNLDILSQCYFGIIIPVKIDKLILDQNSSSSSTFRVADDEQVEKIYIKDIERIKIEYLLENIWSKELLSSMLIKQDPNSYKLSSIKRNITSTSTRMKSSVKEISKQPENKSQLKKTRSTKRYNSLIRKTSIIFSDALKLILSKG